MKRKDPIDSIERLQRAEDALRAEPSTANFIELDAAWFAREAVKRFWSRPFFGSVPGGELR